MAQGGLKRTLALYGGRSQGMLQPPTRVPPPPGRPATPLRPRTPPVRLHLPTRIDGGSTQRPPHFDDGPIDPSVRPDPSLKAPPPKGRAYGPPRRTRRVPYTGPRY